MDARTESIVEGLLVCGVVVALIYLCWVIVDTQGYRREMACRDGWSDELNLTPAECAEILSKAQPPKQTGAPKL